VASEHSSLLTVRQFAAESYRHVDAATDFGSGLAVSLMQDAVELFLRTAAKEHDIDVPKRAEFEELLALVGRGAPGPVPATGKLRDLNRARIQFKHHGVAPAPAAAHKLVGYGEQFLEKASPLYFGLTLASISLADLVKTPTLRDTLRSAEDALGSEKFGEAMQKSREAYSGANHMLLTGVPTPDGTLPSVANVFNDLQERKALRAGFEYVLRYMGELRTQVVAAGVPIDKKRLAQFNRTAPSIVRTVGGRTSVNYPATQTEKNARFCVQFAEEYALCVERHLGR
jgi:hypothetical protein